MKGTYFWIIYSCIIFGTGIQCDRELERRQTVSSCSGDTDDNFNCSNGQFIEWPLVFDGHKDCSDGSDETNELCAIYEFGTNMTIDCGRVNIKNQNISEESSLALAPWNVKIQELTTESKIKYICTGTIIAPNIATLFMEYLTISKQMQKHDGRLKISKYSDNENTHLINVSMVYSPILKRTDANSAEIKIVNIIVFVLVNKFSFDNGFKPICIDWFSKYDLRKKDQMTLNVVKKNFMGLVIQGFFPYIDNMQCMSYFDIQNTITVINDKICIKIEYDQEIIHGMDGSGFAVLHSTSNFLSGVLNSWVKSQKIVESLVITEIQNYVPWIRGIFSKHVTVNSCILPTVEGVIYSFEGSNEILSHGTIIDRHLNVIENCDVGYHKAYPIGFRVCMGKGKWFSSSYKLCHKMCPPLESDSIDFKCSHNCKYANCSNPSIPDTIATPSCKPSYFAKYGEEDIPLELVCQSNGIWNNQLYRCNPFENMYSKSYTHSQYSYKIVGWGKTEKGIESPILLEASLPYIDHNSCRDMYTNGFERYVTVDKFCAGSESGQGVLNGDSGAGLSFLHSKSYYLTGVVSVKDPETNNSVAVFTEIRHHIQWIRRLFNKHN